MKFFTSVYFVIFLCIAGCIVVFFLIREIIRILSINKLREGKNRGAGHVCNLLAERFPEAAVFKNVYFLKDEATKENIKSACDVVYISKGGVLLLTVFSEIGTYDNPKIGAWRHRFINAQKETVTLQKSNPFDTMSFFATVAEKLMVSESVLNPSVTRAVVFSADLVDFTTDYPECLTIGTLFDYVEAFNRRKHFNEKEFARVSDAIRACSDYLEARLPEDKKKRAEQANAKPKAVRRPPVSETK